MAIYDCCMFYNELDMLELRFHILDEVVDHFVVCEAAETHSGQPKPYNLAANADRFTQWTDKIIYVQVDNLTKRNGVADRTSWEREWYHRFCIHEGLYHASPNDWIIVGDCDEIANPQAIQHVMELGKTTNCEGAILEMDMYYYDFNHRVHQGWGIGMMSHHLYHDPNNIRTGAERSFIHIDVGGWHFSWFGGAQQMIAKQQAFMHHADPGVREMSHDPAVIATKVQAGQDLFDRSGFTIEKVPVQDTLPRYVLDHLDHYRQLGWVTA